MLVAAHLVETVGSQEPRNGPHPQVDDVSDVSLVARLTVLWSSQVYNKDLLALGPLGRGRPTELEDEQFDVAIQRGQVVDDFLTRLEWELRSLVSGASRGWRILRLPSSACAASAIRRGRDGLGISVNDSCRLSTALGIKV